MDRDLQNFKKITWVALNKEKAKVTDKLNDIEFLGPDEIVESLQKSLWILTKKSTISNTGSPKKKSERPEDPEMTPKPE